MRAHAMLALLCFLPPLQAFEVRTTPVVGYGAKLVGDGLGILGQAEFPLNEHGIVVVNSVSLTDGTVPGNNLVLTDGDTYSGFFADPGLAITGFGINSQHEVVFQHGPVGSAPTRFQLSRLISATGTIEAASVPYTGYLIAVDVNRDGEVVVHDQGEVSVSPRRIVRLRRDGSATTLPIDSSYLESAVLSKPRILDNGDVYVAVVNHAAGRHEVWRFRAQDPINAEVAFAAGPDTTLEAWGVNEDGRLVLALRAGGAGEPPRSALHRVLEGGAMVAVPGSATEDATYGAAFISRTGLIGAVRHASSTIGSELVYAPPMEAAEVVLRTGEMHAGGTLLTMAVTSDMNELGQMTVFAELDVSPLANPNRKVVLRIDPPGATRDNPILVPPCAIGPGWCFDPPFSGPPGGRDRRLTFVDPAVASGYEYIASENRFTAVHIPYAYGDSRFDLQLWDTASGRYVDTGWDVVTGTTFDFAQLGRPEGIVRFLLTGIEVEAAVDPADPRGFVSGLAFAEETLPRFTMIPVVAGPAADADGDGVRDPEDRCPATPSGLPVDAEGCAASQRDADHDSVPDDRDRCPQSPADVPVDVDGCTPAQIDEDGDGIANTMDRCPGTPPRTPVDRRGCPLPAVRACDADRDGDVDARDLRAIGDARGQRASGDGDPRDAHRNGRIDWRDAAVCALRCDRWLCWGK